MKTSFWTFTSSPLALSAAVLAGGIVLLLAWRHLKLTPWRSLAGRLEILRAAILALLVFTLFQPEYVRVYNAEERSEIVVLHDGSASMSTRDVVLGGTQLCTRAEWVAAQIAAAPWQTLAAHARVSVSPFSAAPSNAAPEQVAATDINGALEAAGRDHASLRAVLLVSDGDWNAGGPPVAAATRFRARDVPVFTITTGRDAFLPDLALESVTAPAYGLIDEHVVIPFAIRSHLDTDVRTTVTLKGPDGMSATRPVVVPARRVLRDAVVLVPAKTGDFEFELSFPASPEELFPDNNSARFRMALRQEVLKVLVVESLPRWEYRFLRNALVRDPGVEVDCLLLHPGMEPGWGAHYIRSFPDSIDALSRYDVVFIGDVGIGERELTEAQAKLLKGLVEHQGSGLIFLPGARGRELSLMAGDLGDLMPVELDPARPMGTRVSVESRLNLTPLGQVHLLTMLDPDAEKNAAIWSRLPGFFWSAPVLKSKPGSETLAVHHALRNEWGRVPLLVIRDFGNGKVLFLGTNGAWRWRRGFEDKYHYRFWSQVVRWMSHKRHLAHNQGMRLFYSPETPQRGDAVHLHATVFDRLGFPLRQKSISARVAAPAGGEEFITLALAGDAWGTFQGEFTPREAGIYHLHLQHPDGTQTMTKEVEVAQPTLENIGQPARPDVLREVARVTGGISGSTDDMAAVIEAVSVLPRNKLLEARLRLWCNPWWGASIVLLLTVYWVGRKVAGAI